MKKVCRVAQRGGIWVAHMGKTLRGEVEMRGNGDGRWKDAGNKESGEMERMER